MSIDPADWWMTPREEAAMEAKLAARRVHYLEWGEYIQEGDEHLNNGKWSKVSYGMTATTVCKAEAGNYRRFKK
jgi:hypothetical protein